MIYDVTMNPQGGTELLYKNFIKYIDKRWVQNTHLFVSSIDERIYDTSKQRILWQHLYVDQPNVQPLNNPQIASNLDMIVFVSEWQRQQFLLHFPLINPNKTCVIRNAIVPIEYKPKANGKINLVYNSMPNRGLDVLLDAYELIDTSNTELIIHSSNIIYGKGYHTLIGNSYDKILHRCKTTKNVTYKGYAINKGVRASLQTSHILAYPSIFPETSCLVAIEAGAAGCKLVTTNYGALPETCLGYNSYIEYTNDRQELVESYAELLEKEIKNYNSDFCKFQSDEFNSKYSWENRKKEWEDLLYA